MFLDADGNDPQEKKSILRESRDKCFEQVSGNGILCPLEVLASDMSTVHYLWCQRVGFKTLKVGGYGGESLWSFFLIAFIFFCEVGSKINKLRLKLGNKWQFEKPEKGRNSIQESRGVNGFVYDFWVAEKAHYWQWR